MNNETIVAIATAPGEGALAVIRVSGVDAFCVASRVFHPAKKITPPPSHLMQFGYLKNTDSGRVFDEVMAVYMAAPRTYTGENTVEITTHGGSTNARIALHALMQAGARVAEPGEFTRRAFLNGRMDLTQVEGVINLIRARSSQTQYAAVKQLKGSTSALVTLVGEKIVSVLVALEAGIDFPEEDIDQAQHLQLKQMVPGIKQNIQTLLSRIQQGTVMRDGINIALIGAPNAGKSTLLNRLLDKDRSIVTDIPGTTRDAIVESILIQGSIFNIADTAGLGGIDDHITQRMYDKTLEYVQTSSVIVIVIDASTPLPSFDATLLHLLISKNILIAFNKSDLPQVTAAADLPLSLSQFSTVSFSAQSGKGADLFTTTLFDIATKDTLQNTDDIVFAEADQKQYLLDTLSALEDLEAGFASHESEDLLAEHARSALECLKYFSGENISEKILDQIFSTFCIGK